MNLIFIFAYHMDGTNTIELEEEPKIFKSRKN